MCWCIQCNILFTYIAQIFDDRKSINQLENFVSRNGAFHYNLNLNKDKIKLFKSDKQLSFRKYIRVNSKKIKIFQPNFSVFWKIGTLV